MGGSGFRRAWFFLSVMLAVFVHSVWAETVKMIDGRIQSVNPKQREITLSFQDPVSGKTEKLVLRVDAHTGFGEGVRFEDLKAGEPVAADYREEAGGPPLAVQIRRVPLTGVPFDKVPFRDSAGISFRHGLKSKEEGKLLAAESHFRKVLEIDPDNPDPHFELGNLLVERDELEGARREYEQALMIDAAHVPSHYNLGLVYWAQGLLAEAREEFRKALEYDPSNVRAQLQIGYTYQAEGFWEDARQAFEKAGEMNYSDPEPQRALQTLQEGARDRSENDETRARRLQSGSHLIGQLFAERYSDESQRS